MIQSEKREFKIDKMRFYDDYSSKNFNFFNNLRLMNHQSTNIAPDNNDISIGAINVDIGDGDFTLEEKIENAINKQRMRRVSKIISSNKKNKEKMNS